MTIEANFRELFSETVTLYAASTRDVYGKWSHSSSSVSAPAHIVADQEVLRDSDGREVIQTGKVYLYGIFDVDTRSRIVFADGSEPIIIAVDQPYDQNGAHHTVVRVGEIT